MRDCSAASPEGDLEVLDRDVAHACPLDDETMSLWKLYLLIVASLGLYLPFWVYRRAKLNGEGTEFSSTPAWWGFGTLAAPVACAVLYDFSCKAEGTSGRRRGPLWRVLPSVIHLVVLLAIFLTVARSPLVASIFLLPIPFLTVQHRINTSLGQWSEATGVRPFRFRVRHWLLLVVGVPAVVALWWIHDPSSYSAWLTRPLAEGSTVTGNSGLYELETPSGAWKRVGQGTVAQDESDLELIRENTMTWIIVYESEKGEIGLEEAIKARRDLTFLMAKPLEFKDKRYFLEGSDLVPASLAHYRVDSVGEEHYYVLTALLESGLVEVVGYTAEPDLNSAELREFVTSFRERPSGREP